MLHAETWTKYHHSTVPHTLVQSVSLVVRSFVFGAGVSISALSLPVLPLSQLSPTGSTSYFDWLKVVIPTVLSSDLAKRLLVDGPPQR